MKRAAEKVEENCTEIKFQEHKKAIKLQEKEKLQLNKLVRIMHVAHAGGSRTVVNRFAIFLSIVQKLGYLTITNPVIGQWQQLFSRSTLSGSVLLHV